MGININVKLFFINIINALQCTHITDYKDYYKIEALKVSCIQCSCHFLSSFTAVEEAILRLEDESSATLW